MFSNNALEDITNAPEHPHLETIRSVQPPHLQILQPYSKAVVESTVDIAIENIVTDNLCSDNSAKVFSAYTNLADSPLRYSMFSI